MSNSETSSADCADLPKFNSIQWNELITSDPDGAMKFYGGLFGWTTQPFPESASGYTIFLYKGTMFGGVMAPPQPGIPSHWLNYVSVEKLEPVIDKATSLGAAVCVGPMDIGSAGRIAILTDPQGAAIGLHEAPPM